MALSAPSGERRPVSPRVVNPSSSMPLAGRSSFQQRLEAFRRRGEESAIRIGFLGLPETKSAPLDDAMFDAPEENPFAWPAAPRYASARLCVACALGAAALTALVAIALFALTRSAAAMVPALPPRELPQLDPGSMLLGGIVTLVLLALAVAGAFVASNRADATDPALQALPEDDCFDPDHRHLVPRYQPPTVTKAEAGRGRA